MKAFVLINADLGKEDEVKDLIAKLPESPPEPLKKLLDSEKVEEKDLRIVELYKVYGVHDLLAILEGEKVKEAVAYGIRHIPGVRSTLTMMVVED